MKKVLVIIRTCQKDDFISYLCYKSFQSVMNADYLFFAEEGEYKWIKETGEKVLWRAACGNFGGQSGLYVVINGLKVYNIEQYGKIILSDSDITLFKNPLDYQYDFGGIKSATNERHYSGQLLIFSKNIWDKVMQYEHYDKLIKSFVDSGTIDVADDTCMSWVATEYTENVFNFS